MREIGSEFWLETMPETDKLGNGNEYKDVFAFGNDHVRLLSGRTAIDFVLNDIPQPVATVYVPSYCCQSMLQPFLDRDIQLCFYDVVISSSGLEYVVDHDRDIDIFFASSYFGFHTTVMDDHIVAFRNRGVVAIEDITHRLLSDQSHCKGANYLIASLRKWFPIPSGGLAVKMDGCFETHRLKAAPDKLIRDKVRAMMKKANYIMDLEGRSDSSHKNEFLELYRHFNEDLSLNYEDHKMDDFSEGLLHTMNIEDVQKRRRSNAEYIYEYLNGLEHIRPLIPQPDFNNDCPLFVPVMIKAEYRDGLRDYLSENSVFCPVHWPIPESVAINSRNVVFYEEELSLVCDQRYSGTELDVLLNLLGAFENTI